MRRTMVTGLLIFAVGCGDDTGKSKSANSLNSANSVNNVNSLNSTNSANSANSVNNTTPTVRQALDGIRAPQTAIDLGEASSNLVAEGVFLASQLNGGTQIVATGTLVQQGNTATFEYSATPSDSLVIDWSEGADTVFTITAFDGDFSSDAETFLNRDHDLQFRVTRDATADVAIASLQTGGSKQGSINGSVVVDDVTFQVNLTQQGTYSSTVEPTYVEHESSDAISGSITGEGFDLVVNETFDFKLALFDRGITNVTRTANNTWTAGGASYALTGLFVRYEGEEMAGQIHPTTGKPKVSSHATGNRSARSPTTTRTHSGLR